MSRTVCGASTSKDTSRQAMARIESERVRAVIRPDNGAPFASNAPGGITKLSLWWERLGIRHERIEPGKPQQNGRHERIHLSLLRDRLDQGVAWDLRAQQRVFEHYQREFNEERPHEALEMQTPSERVPAWREALRRPESRI